MIDVSEPVSTSAPPQGRRRSSTVTATRTSRSDAPQGKKTLSVERTFSDPNTSPFDQIEWERRTAEITDDAGKVIFKQENVEVPKSWSLLATKVVVSKYFYGEQGTPERETSVRQLIHRICRTIADWGVKDGYFTKAGGRGLLRRADLAVPEPVRRVQFAGLVQRRALSPVSASATPPAAATGSIDRKHGHGRAGEDPIRISAVQRLLHPVRRGQHGVHHAPGPQRGDALQVRLRHRHRPFAHPLRARRSSAAAAGPAVRCPS